MMNKERVEWAISAKQPFPLIAKLEGVTTAEIRTIKVEMRDRARHEKDALKRMVTALDRLHHVVPWRPRRLPGHEKCQECEAIESWMKFQKTFPVY